MILAIIMLVGRKMRATRQVENPPTSPRRYRPERQEYEDHPFLLIYHRYYRVNLIETKFFSHHFQRCVCACLCVCVCVCVKSLSYSTYGPDGPEGIH